MKWQCNDLKSKQRMCLCVDRLLHPAILAPLPFTQSWLVGLRPIRGQGHWIFCKITKWQRQIHKRLLLDSDQCQRAHTYLWFRDFHLEFGANLFDCSHSGGILRQIRRRNAAPLPERRHQWGWWGGDRARAGKKIGLGGDRTWKKKIWGIRMDGSGGHKQAPAGSQDRGFSKI